VASMLKALPPTLDATYTRMLERIGPAVSEDALTLLRWLAYGMRPVTLAELQTAVTIRPEDYEVDYEDEGDFRDSLDILAGLVVFSDGTDPTEDGRYTQYNKARVETQELTPHSRVRLAHFSVKEYLESERISGSSASFFKLEPGTCHKFLAQSCLTYLMSYSKSGEKTSTKLDLARFHLLRYASHHWYEHSRLRSDDDVSREIALLECEDARRDWLAIEYNERRHLISRISHKPSIYFAVSLRLSRVVQELLAAGKDANVIGLHHTPVLVTATENKDQTTVELLLAHGADVNMASIHPIVGYALWYAASRGLLLTKLLVDNGADVNLECRRGTPLSAACGTNDQLVVKFLLERGARIDTVDRGGDTALITASGYGHPEMVKLLIANGADVNNPNTYTTPLGAAAGFGRTDVMVILVDAGADLDAHGSSALLKTLLGGHEHTATFLEAKGAKKLKLEQLNKALIQVCNDENHKCPEKAVELLLNRGADVSAEDSSALLDAMRSGQEDTVAFLEAKGATKPTLDQLNMALFRVCNDENHKCPEKAVELLLDRGADVSAGDSSVLLDALRSGQEDTVALLEAKGATKPTLDQLNMALFRVCNDKNHWCREKAVELLLDRGADVSAEDSSALLDAMLSGQEDTVALLEAKGANKPTLKQLKDALTEVRGDLHLNRWNRRSAVQMLLDRGADVDAANSETSLIA
jgi:ankyrin repeat protein